jgi:hypothetical protein
MFPGQAEDAGAQPTSPGQAEDAGALITDAGAASVTADASAADSDDAGGVLSEIEDAATPTDATDSSEMADASSLDDDDAGAQSGDEEDAATPSSDAATPPPLGPVPAQAGKCKFNLEHVLQRKGTHWDGVDITEPHADILASRAFVSGGDAIIQVFFAAPPFAFQAADFLDVLFDNDRDPTDGRSGGGPNGQVWHFDSYIGIQGDGNGSALVSDSPREANAARISELLIDLKKSVLQIRAPLSQVSDTNKIRYALVSAFGGSRGANDAQPEQGDTFLKSTSAKGAHQVCEPAVK